MCYVGLVGKEEVVVSSCVVCKLLLCLLSESLCHRELRQYLYIVTLLQCRNLVQKRSDLTMVGMPEEGTAVGESDRVLSLLQRTLVVAVSGLN